MARFTPGKSGNPAGKPRGTKNKSTQLMEALLDQWGENLTKKLIQLALKGDVQALRLVFERLMPVRKDRPITFPLPEITTALDIPRATAAILEGATNGELSPSDAEALMGLIEGHRGAIETHILAAEVAEVRAMVEAKAKESTDV
ncbi:DUF5681 domain-containing protein [Methylobacterium sp. J-026]|uniref:DUF5681 domain-containing protein n=1 Tax=Methylobacterium sp. J-026 TaxID=2836624 RepID=UPI001FB8AAAC|nr:DUF5681 domain-containing protein [Methylobacterium sp. J-026]MCJ2135609.1 DUF5681 domain-containing protein [Methylobacterium sp. J-026]